MSSNNKGMRRSIDDGDESCGESELEPSEEFPILYSLLTAPDSNYSSSSSKGSHQQINNSYSPHHQSSQSRIVSKSDVRRRRGECRVVEPDSSTDNYESSPLLILRLSGGGTTDLNNNNLSSPPPLTSSYNRTHYHEEPQRSKIRRRRGFCERDELPSSTTEESTDRDELTLAPSKIHSDDALSLRNLLNSSRHQILFHQYTCCLKRTQSSNHSHFQPNNSNHSHFQPNHSHNSNHSHFDTNQPNYSNFQPNQPEHKQELEESGSFSSKLEDAPQEQHESADSLNKYISLEKGSCSKMLNFPTSLADLLEERKSFRLPSDLEIRQIKNNDGERKRKKIKNNEYYPCTDCSRTFSSFTQLLKHSAGKHLKNSHANGTFHFEIETFSPSTLDV